VHRVPSLIACQDMHIRARCLVTRDLVLTTELSCRGLLVLAHSRAICSVVRKGVIGRDAKRGGGTPQTAEVPAEAAPDSLTQQGNAEILTLAASRNTIEEETFFDQLPNLLGEVQERVQKLLALEQQSVQKLQELQSLPKEASVGENDDADSRDQPEEDMDDVMSAGPEVLEGSTAAAELPADDEEDLLPDARPTHDLDAQLGAEVDGQEDAPAVEPCPDDDDPETCDAPPETKEAELAEARPEEGSIAGVADEGAADAAGTESPPNVAADAAVTSMSDKLPAAKVVASQTGDAATSAARLRAAAVEPQAETLLDELLDGEVTIDDSELEHRLMQMNKGMPKCVAPGASAIRDLAYCLTVAVLVTRPRTRKHRDHGLTSRGVFADCIGQVRHWWAWSIRFFVACYLT
jgi:hypothetical protein